MLSRLVTGVRRGLECVQGKLSFEGWNDYPLFRTKQVRSVPFASRRQSLLCETSTLLMCSRVFVCFSAGSWAFRLDWYWFGLLFGISCLWLYCVERVATLGTRRRQQQGLLLKKQQPLHLFSMAMVRLCVSSINLSLVGILYNGLVQSNGSFVGFLSRESFHQLHRGGTHLVDRICPQVFGVAAMEFSATRCICGASAHNYRANDTIGGHDYGWTILQSSHSNAKEGKSRIDYPRHLSHLSTSFLCGILLLVHWDTIVARQRPTYCTLCCRVVELFL